VRFLSSRSAIAQFFLAHLELTTDLLLQITINVSTERSQITDGSNLSWNADQRHFRLSGETQTATVLDTDTWQTKSKLEVPGHF
jgi:hypothetical protein